jgi:hypothetical protein
MMDIQHEESVRRFQNDQLSDRVSTLLEALGSDHLTHTVLLQRDHLWWIITDHVGSRSSSELMSKHVKRELDIDCKIKLVAWGHHDQVALQYRRILDEKKQTASTMVWGSLDSLMVNAPSWIYHTKGDVLRKLTSIDAGQLQAFLNIGKKNVLLERVFPALWDQALQSPVFQPKDLVVRKFPFQAKPWMDVLGKDLESLFDYARIVQQIGVRFPEEAFQSWLQSATLNNGSSSTGLESLMENS